MTGYDRKSSTFRTNYHGPSSPNGPRTPTIAEHTHHKDGSPGSQCVACQMPEIENFSSQSIRRVQPRFRKWWEQASDGGSRVFAAHKAREWLNGACKSPHENITKERLKGVAGGFVEPGPLTKKVPSLYC
jgi:hypothetical protein